MDNVTNLPIAPQNFWTLVVVLSILALSAVVYLILSWMGRDHRPPIWEKLREGWQGPAIFLGLLWLGLFALTIVAAYLGVLLAIHPKDAAGQPNLGLGALLAALLGAPFLIWGTVIKQRTLALSETALFNDKLNAAVEALYSRRQVTRLINTGGEQRVLTEWEDDIVQRSAAIDRLEGLSRERPGEAPRIASMLSVYVRELSREFPAKDPPRRSLQDRPESSGDPSPFSDANALSQLSAPSDDATVDVQKTWARNLRPFRTDVEKAVQTLGRLKVIRGLGAADISIDLREANLQGFDLTGLSFTKVNLSNARMQEARLWATQLDLAKLREARLEGADLYGARMNGADLFYAQMTAADLREAQLEGADLFGARLEGADLSRARMQDADLRWIDFDEKTNWTETRMSRAGIKSSDFSKTTISPDQINSTFGDSSTTLPIAIPRPSHWPMVELSYEHFLLEWAKWRADSASYQPPEPHDPTER